MTFQNGYIIEVELLSDEDLLTDKWDGPRLSKEDINGINHSIILTKTTLIKPHLFGDMYLLYKSRFTHNKNFIFT